jgi:recombination protein RecA
MAKVILRKVAAKSKLSAPITDEPKAVVKTKPKAAPKAKKLVNKSAPDNFSANFMAGALKVLGKNTDATIEVLKEDDETQNITSTIKLGIPQLDEMLCDSKDYGMSGLPIGRSMELFGKQASCKTAIIEYMSARVSAAGGRVLYLDYERAMDPKHLKGYGADFSRIERAKLDSMEDGWNVIYVFLKALPKEGPPNLIVWDTVAAAPTKDELEGKNGMAHQARVMSVHTRIFRGRLMRSNCAAVFVNQVRTKPGVCLRYDVPVLLPDGTTKKIGKLVHDRQKVSVATLDEKTNKVMVKEVSDFYRSEYTGDWYNVQTAGGANGRRSVIVTPDHKILTPDGWVAADTLKIGDRVVTADIRYYTEDQHRVIYGSLLGDGQIRFGDGKSKTSEKGRLRLGHGIKQKDYLAWKCKLLGMPKPKVYGVRGCYSDSVSTAEMQRYKAVTKHHALYKIPAEFIAKIDALVATIWFLDDGTYVASHGGLKYGSGRYVIYATKLPEYNKQEIINHFAKIGMGRPTSFDKGFKWDGKQAQLFGEAIAKYVPTCMQYKLNRLLKPGGDDLVLEKMRPTLQRFTNAVTKCGFLKKDNARKHMAAYKYDITVPKTHNFIAGGGIVVHNSFGDPTSRPCGSALDFMCDVMVKTTNIGTEFKKIKGVNTPISYNIQWRTFKARFSQAKKNVVWSLSLKTGVDQATSIIKHLIAEGVAKQTETGYKIPGAGVHTAISLAEWIEEQGEEIALDTIKEAISVPASKKENTKKSKAPVPDLDDEDQDADAEVPEDSDDD